MHGWLPSVKAFLPPTERRGLVLIDSSFDRAREFDRLTLALAEAHRRWATGIFALWYPLMEAHAVRAFERGVVATGIRKILKLEFSVLPQKWSRVAARLRHAGGQSALWLRTGGGAHSGLAMAGTRRRRAGRPLRRLVVAGVRQACFTLL